MKRKKDLEFTPPLDEYTYPEKDANHIPKDEFHQRSATETKSAQGRAGWKKKLRHMLTAGVAAVVLVSTVVGDSTVTDEYPSCRFETSSSVWGGHCEFDLELNGTRFHFPCHMSEVLDFVEREGGGLEWNNAWGEFHNDGFAVTAADDKRDMTSIQKGWCSGVDLFLLEKYEAVSFNYEGITEQSTWNDCISRIGVPDFYHLMGEGYYSARWYEKKLKDKVSPRFELRFQDDMMEGVDFSEVYYAYDENMWNFRDKNVETGTIVDTDEWFSIRYTENDRTDYFSIVGIYVFDTNEGMPRNFDDLPGKNILGNTEIKVGDTIQVPKPEFADWSIAFVCVYTGLEGEYTSDKHAVIFTFFDEIITKSGGDIKIGYTTGRGGWVEVNQTGWYQLW